MRDGIYPKDELLAACFDAEEYACYKMKRMGQMCIRDRFCF